MKEHPIEMSPMIHTSEPKVHIKIQKVLEEKGIDSRAYKNIF